MFFWRNFFRLKMADILNFQWIKYLDKGLWWGIGVYYCWNYEPSKLLLHFIACRLDQFNNKHTKIAVNSEIQYFEGHCQRKCLLKVWGFLVHPTQNGSPVKFLQNWTENILFGWPIFSNFKGISDIWFNKNASYEQNLICQ